jgi:hypothetical protein
LSDDPVTAADQGIAYQGRVIDGTTNTANTSYSTDTSDAAHASYAPDPSYTPDSADTTEWAYPCR